MPDLREINKIRSGLIQFNMIGQNILYNSGPDLVQPLCTSSLIKQNRFIRAYYLIK